MTADKLKIEMKLRDAQYDSLLQLEDVLQKATVFSRKVIRTANSRAFAKQSFAKQALSITVSPRFALP